MPLELRSLLGVAVVLALVALLSERRRAISPRLILVGLALQFVAAVAFLKVPLIKDVVYLFSQGIAAMFQQAESGAQFVFGDFLTDASGPAGFVFAVKVLPLLIFFSSLVAVLYHLGVMQRVIVFFAWIFQRSLKVTGHEALVVSANIFLGQAEAPLCVKPYLAQFTRSQLATLMVSGFATVAGTVLGAYIVFLGGDDEARRVFYTAHLITASVISAPAAFVISKMLVPEMADVEVRGALDIAKPEDHYNLLGAATDGAKTGMQLAVRIAAMLIALISLLSLANWPVTAITEYAFNTPYTIEQILGSLLRPLAWLLGIPWAETNFFGQLLGEKLILTEFVAYQSLGEFTQSASSDISQRSIIMATYALCGFSNIASVAVQVGALTQIAPEQKKNVLDLGVKCAIGGQFASLLTAAVVGVLV